MRLMMAAMIVLLGAPKGFAEPRTEVFSNIDGGTLALSTWAGQPILIVNTASQCGFTYQYDGLQALYDANKGRGLVVLAVPSDDFNQELSSADEVKEFCEISFGLDLPMADITHVRGPQAHSFYQAVADEVGFVPKWNFNKVLIGPDGRVVDAWGAATRPQSTAILNAIKPLLN